jgi:antitoxin ParD1/3/4
MATHRTTVNVSITPELDAFLQSRVKSGRYQTTSEVAREALRLLERHEQERDEAFQQLKAKLQRGAAQADRGELIDGDEVFDELRELIQERRRVEFASARPGKSDLVRRTVLAQTVLAQVEEFTLEKPEATQRSDPEGAPNEPSALHGAETAATQPGQTTQNDGLPYGPMPLRTEEGRAMS